MDGNLEVEQLGEDELGDGGDERHALRSAGAGIPARGGKRKGKGKEGERGVKAGPSEGGGAFSSGEAGHSEGEGSRNPTKHTQRGGVGAGQGGVEGAGGKRESAGKKKGLSDRNPDRAAAAAAASPQTSPFGFAIFFRRALTR